MYYSFSAFGSRIDLFEMLSYQKESVHLLDLIDAKQNFSFPVYPAVIPSDCAIFPRAMLLSYHSSL